jgi:hypothetical protein
MFARITHYKMKAGSRDAATDLLNSLRDQIMGMPGMHHFLNAANEDGSGYVVSVVESEAVSNANADKVAKIWSNFADYLEGPPKTEGYDVIANWSN